MVGAKERPCKVMKVGLVVNEGGQAPCRILVNEGGQAPCRILVKEMIGKLCKAKKTG